MSSATETKPKRVPMTPEQRRERRNARGREATRRRHDRVLAELIKQLDRQAPNPITFDELRSREWHGAIAAARSEARSPNARLLITSKRVDKELVSYVTRYDAAALTL